MTTITEAAHSKKGKIRYGYHRRSAKTMTILKKSTGLRRGGRYLIALWIVLLAGSIGGTETAEAQSLEPNEDFNKGARTSMQFLKIGLGARQSAMGEASIAMVRDVNSVFWNPANISGIGTMEVSFSYVRWLADMNYVSGAIGYRLGSLGVLAGYVGSLDYGNIPEALAVSPTGNNDTRTGASFTGGDLMAGLSFSREFTDRLSIGISAKYLHERLWDFNTSTIAFDVGTNYDLGFKGIRLAMSAQNFGGAVNYLEQGSQTEEYDLPIIFRIGLSANVISGSESALLDMGPSHRMRFGFEAINTNDFSERLHFGAEYTFGDFIALRGGYRFNYEEGSLSAGFGLFPSIGNMEARIDYSYVQYEFLDAPHRFSVTLAY